MATVLWKRWSLVVLFVIIFFTGGTFWQFDGTIMDSASSSSARKTSSFNSTSSSTQMEADRSTRRQDKEAKSPNNSASHIDQRSSTPTIESLHVESSSMEWYRPTRKFTNDVFAAAWWQPISRFLECDTNTIHIVEDDSFKPILKAGQGIADARLSADYLDFCIEHLSRWWKWNNQASSMEYATEALRRYIQRVSMESLPQTTLMNTTLAVIPYGVSWDIAKNPTKTKVWITALIATIVSLMRQNMARIVIVGHYKADWSCTKQAFWALEHLQAHANVTFDGLSAMMENSEQYTEPFGINVGSTELAYVHVQDVETKHIKKNIPKGALAGLQTGIRSSHATWMGETPDRYKYIYLTEADQILHARLNAAFLQELDDNHIIIPHRLQPIPHPFDFGNDTLPPADSYPSVHVLDPVTDSCCDTEERIDIRQTRKQCSNLWWLCGVSSQNIYYGNFSYLTNYKLIQLSDGTGIVSLAATPHSRRCTPAKNKRKCIDIL